MAEILYWHLIEVCCVSWSDRKKERQMTVEYWTRRQSGGILNKCLKSTQFPSGFYFYFSVALCSVLLPWSLLTCPSRQSALCFGLSESTVHSCVGPICDVAFDFALPLCTSWVIKHWERWQRNVRCCSPPETHIALLGCCQIPCINLTCH